VTVTAARFALAAVLVQAIGPAKAQAQHWEGSLSLSSIGGWSDNITPNLVGPAVADYFLQLQPRVLFHYETPRTITELSYDLSAFLYATETNANSMSHNAQLSSRTRLSPRARLRLNLGVSAGQLNTLQLAAGPDANTGEIVADTSDFVSFDLSQRLRWEVNRNTLLLQRYSINLFDRKVKDTGVPVSRGSAIGTSLALRREWKRDSADLSAGVSVNDLTNNRECRCEDVTTLSQFDFDVGVRWQRSLTPRWTSTVDGGLTRHYIPGQQVVNTLRPSGAAELAYFDRWGGLVLAYQHSIQPNLSIASNTTTDGASLRAWLPVPYLRGEGPVPRVAITSTVGTSYGRVIDLVNNTTPPTWTTSFFDTALVWLIRRTDLTLALRYQHTRQRADTGVVVSYDRNAITISLSGSLSKGRPRAPILRSAAGEDREDKEFMRRGE